VTRAIFFDVDFTLIRPGRAFQGLGYRDFCAAHGVEVDVEAFDRAVAAAQPILNVGGDTYDPAVFVSYTSRIIEEMGGSGPGVEQAARRIYEEWAACHHFELYDDVPDVLRALHADGYRIGLISNTQRCLTSFQQHFNLEGIFTFTVSSFDHGFMKPHPSIFEAALRGAGVRARDSVMVGDSLAQDIEGARQAGMRAVLLARTKEPLACPPDVPVIQSLRELPTLLHRTFNP
jgi:putative hydrolase of the HAD superfamily